MPLQLSVGLSKKQGLPDYGSLGASCSVTVELDGSLLHDDLEAFHKSVKNAYVACSQAVNDEIARQREHEGNGGHQRLQQLPTTTAASPPVETDTRSSSAGNGSNGHGASQKQVEYIHQLARQIRGLGIRKLDALCDRMFSKPLADLSSFEASAAIDQLKAIKAGQINLDEALGAGEVA